MLLVYSFQSFYLPGSVNDEDKQLEDWNNVPPPLSLWSRSDFAAKHKKIAEKHYHLFRDVGSSNLKKFEEEANASLHPLGASDGMCDNNTMPRDSPFEISEKVTLDNEDGPMEKDELEVAECVNNILLSEKIEAHVHQSDHLSRRSQLKKEEMTKDYSGRKLKKSMDSNNVDWKSFDLEEDRGELNRALESMKVKIPEKSSDCQSPVRSSPDDIYAVCTSISNTTPQRPHESVEASLPAITRTKSNLGKNIREPDSKVESIGKPEVTRNRPSSVRSSREDINTVRPSPANTGQKPFEAFESSYGVSLSHFDDGLAARYGFGGGYTMPDPPFIPDQFPLAPSMRNGPNEMFDFRGYSELDRGVGPREYSQQYVEHLDPMLAPPPPNLMDNAFPLQQRYAPHFDQMNYQRMSSFPPQPPMRPSGHNLFDPHGFPLQPPPPSDFEMSPRGFAPGPNPNYPYISRSGGWIND